MRNVPCTDPGPPAELDGVRRAWRCHLHQAPVLAPREISVQPPLSFEKTCGAIDVGRWDDDDVECQVGRYSGGRLHCVFFVA